MRLAAERGRVAVSVALVCTLVLLAVGCSSKGSDRSGAGPTTSRPSPSTGSANEGTAGPFKVLADAVAPPGTTLVAGLQVPARSDLLGPVFPDLDGRGGFLALGLVLGDPVTVFNDYLAQAGLLGMSVSDGGVCLTVAGAIACARTVTDASDGEALTVRVERRAAGDGEISHVALRYQPPGSVPLDSIGPALVSPPTDPLPTVTLPAQVPKPAESALNATVAPFGPAIAVQPGTTLVAPPGPCGCAPKGWSAVVRVTGDPGEALAAYAATVTHAAVKPVALTAGGKRILVADLGLVAGGFVQLRTVTQRGVSYLMIAVATP